MTDPTGNSPYRVVDRDNQGWYLASDGNGGQVYRAANCYRWDLYKVPDYPALEAARGPLRPVRAADPADTAELDRRSCPGLRK